MKNSMKRYQSSNYLTSVKIETLNLIPVDSFMKNPPKIGFGYIYKDGYIDDEFTVDHKTIYQVAMDATHVIWFKNDTELKNAASRKVFDWGP